VTATRVPPGVTDRVAIAAVIDDPLCVYFERRIDRQ
jgi:hypothetical protein